MTHTSLFDIAIFDGDVMFDTGARVDLDLEVPTTILRSLSGNTTVFRALSGNTTVLRASTDNTTIRMVDFDE